MQINSATKDLYEIGLYSGKSPVTEINAGYVEEFIDEVIFKARPLGLVLADLGVENFLSHYFPELKEKSENGVGVLLYTSIIASLTKESIKYRGIQNQTLPKPSSGFSGENFVINIPEVEGVASIWDHNGGFGQDITLEFGDERSRAMVCLNCSYPHDYLDEGSLEVDSEKPAINIELLKETVDDYGRHSSVIGLRSCLTEFDGKNGKIEGFEVYDEGFESYAFPD